MHTRPIRILRAEQEWWLPTLGALTNSIWFVIARLPVGDLWAARAHQSAAAHGVKIEYWFAWFDGAAPPGGYSVITPYLSAVVGSGILGALATVSITVLCHVLVRGSAHPLAATWAATVVAGANLWSGRIPFALGTAATLAALIAVRADRRITAIVSAAVVALVSPVSAAFLVLGLSGVFLVHRRFRLVTAMTMASAGTVLIVLGLAFGSPGPEPFSATQGRAVALSLVALLIARPATSVVAVVLVSIAALPILVMVPNGLGSNFERLAWICLPVAVVATARVRVSVAALAALGAMSYGIATTVHDVKVAVSPLSSASRYAPLTAELDRLPHLASYRVEVVPDGTHTAAYALLQHATLARGYETQTDRALNDVLMHWGLTASSYRAWLDDNAVGYVVLDRATLQNSSEYWVVSHGAPYLQQVWSNANWRMFRVRHARPIVSAPAVVTDADQSNLVIRTSQAGTFSIRVRWSPYLDATEMGAGSKVPLLAERGGWTLLEAPHPGTYRLSA